MWIVQWYPWLCGNVTHMEIGSSITTRTLFSYVPLYNFAPCSGTTNKTIVGLLTAPLTYTPLCIFVQHSGTMNQVNDINTCEFCTFHMSLNGFP